MVRRVAAAAAAGLLLAALVGAGAGPEEAWPQWGGPGRDFRVPGVDLARAWPDPGPKVLWRRPLGEGYSAIAAADGRLVTMYRTGDYETVAAFAAEDGRTLWEHRYPAPPPAEMRLGFGSGPHSTPLIVGGRVFAVGTTARLSVLDAATGELRWSRDLWKDFGGNVLVRGYAASPLAWRDTVIVPVGGAGYGIVALAQEDGHVVWHAQDFESSPSSPILIEVDGQEQLITFVTDEVAALDPATGALRWHFPHPAIGAYNVSTPIWDPDHRLLFVSSAYGSDSRGLHLAAHDGEPAVAEAWHSTQMRIHFTNAVLRDGYVYGSTGRGGGIVLAALDARTGEFAWKDRAVGRANLVLAGELAVILEDEGRLLLAELKPSGLEVLAQTQLLDGKTWTVPSLVGHTLYVRNESVLMALELPAGSSSPES